MSGRRQMWETDPHCYWCGVETRWEAPSDGVLSNDAATLDHVYSALHPERRRCPYGRSPVVLACHRCNRERSVNDCLAFGGNPPRNPPRERGMIQPTPGIIGRLRPPSKYDRWVSRSGGEGR